MKQQQIIGIVGGLGPHAHIDFEQKLMQATRELTGATRDQEYPEWVLSSVPQTPDRTEAFLGNADDPAPYLLRSLQRLEQSGAGFAVIVCNTAHLYLNQIINQIEIPIFNMLEVASERTKAMCPGGKVGILATTGTVKSKLYHKILSGQGLVPFSPLDLTDGETLQRRYVMEAIFGPLENGIHQGGGIKTHGKTEKAKRLLTKVAQRLVKEGYADILLAGCTEIPLVLDTLKVAGKPLVDPSKLLAYEAVRAAYGLKIT